MNVKNSVLRFDYCLSMIVRSLTREPGQYVILVVKQNSDLNLNLEVRDSFVQLKIDIFIYF